MLRPSRVRITITCISKSMVSHILKSIVAIHGIGAHPFHTWSYWDPNRKSIVNWLRDEDMLLTDLSPARVMIFGYRSEWKGQRPSDVTSAEVANRLLDSLARARKVRGNSDMRITRS